MALRFETGESVSGPCSPRNIYLVNPTDSQETATVTISAPGMTDCSTYSETTKTFSVAPRSRVYVGLDKANCSSMAGGVDCRPINYSIR